MTTKRRRWRQPNQWGQLTPLEIALSQARKFTVDEVAKVRAASSRARQALQFGGFNAAHWSALAEALNHAEGLAQPGINLAPDHLHTIEAGQQALADLRHRRATRNTWAATAADFKALDDALWVWGVQLSHVSVGEYRRAQAWMLAQERAARAGQPGRTVVHVDDIED